MPNSFSQRLLHWFDQHGRKQLPWKINSDPYRIWLSEIMLQQTQVATVIPYFERFVQTYPTASDLASATMDDVLALWSGLGYYSRARNLHRAAEIIQTQHHGKFPRELDELIALPGIGRSTAGAILAQSFGLRHPILDGNVKRVLCRYHAIEGWPGEKAIENQLWDLADQHTPSDRVADYTQAIMDLGATCCTRSKPSCTRCPMESDCLARQQDNTHLYPQKKPRKALPTRHTQMLLLTTDNRHFLFTKRPPSGIWGGLWSLPECEVDISLSSWAKEQGFTINRSEAYLPFRHTFSHFHLEIQPHILQGEFSNRVLEPSNQQWIDIMKPMPVGIPAPVEKLIKQFQRI